MDLGMHAYIQNTYIGTVRKSRCLIVNILRHQWNVCMYVCMYVFIIKYVCICMYLC